MKVFCLVLLMTPWVTGMAAAGPIDFAIPALVYQNHPLGTMAIEDLDADGLSDVISLDRWSDQPSQEFPFFGVVVQRNLGSGALGAPERYRIGGQGYDDVRQRLLDRVDLNGDGRRDLLIEAGFVENSQLAILIRGVGATFRAPLVFSLGRNIKNVAAGDLDGDGRIDLAVALHSDPFNEWIVLLRNTGNGNFALAGNLDLGFDPGAVGIGDMNGDAHADLVLGATSSWLLNLGNFAFGIPTPLGVALGADRIECRDLDGDGDVDLVTQSSFAPYSLYHNDGTGHFAFATSFPIHSPSQPLEIDVDHDGKPDRVFAADTRLHILFDRGGGTYEYANYSGMGTSNDVLTGDFNGDGWADFVIPGGPWMTPFVSQGGPTYTTGEPVTPLGAYVSAGVLDADGDGDEDLLFSRGQGGALLRCRGDGTFPSPRRAALPVWKGRPVVADFDHDGKADLLTHDDTQLTIRISADGTSHTTLVPISHPGPIRDCAAADFNQDGWLDLAVACSDGTWGTLYVFFGQSGGTAYTLPVEYLPGATPTAVTTGDFDADGHIDLVSNGWQGYALLLHNTGNGTFSGPTYVGGQLTTQLATGDFDRDGRLDILAGGVVLLNNLDGTQFTTQARLGVVAPVVVADFDGDGSADVFGTTGTSASGLFMNNGDGSFGDPVPYVGSPNSSLALGDFDGSGFPDIAVFVDPVYSDQNRLLLLSNNGNGSFETRCDQGVDVGPESVVIDWDSDGRIDIVTPTTFLRNHSGDPTPVVLEDFSATMLASAVSLHWRIAPRMLPTVQSVRVQRALSMQGPFVDLEPGLEPAAVMAFEDASIEAGVECWYRLHLSFTAGGDQWSAALHVASDRDAYATRLRSVYRSSSSNAFEIHYSLGQPGRIDLRLFDVRGRLVRTLVEGASIPGEYLRTWDATDASGRRVARGMYVLRLGAAGVVLSQKVIVSRP